MRTTDNAPTLIRQVLDATGWSQPALADRLGVHRQTVQDWAKGKQRPRTGVYTDLHRILLEHVAEVEAVMDRLKAAPDS